MVVLCLTQKGQGAPGREPVFSEEEKKQMMLHAYHRQEELKVRTYAHAHLLVLDGIIKKMTVWY